MTRRVIEIAGPAGAGKTTLALRLAEDPSTSVGVDTSRYRLLTAVTSVTPVLAAARVASSGRWWTHGELRGIAYLRAWRTALSQEVGTGLVLLDHGPAYRLASLAAFGPPMSRSGQFKAWWTKTAEDWALCLDAVVLLDTRDDELRRRIDDRDRDHELRGAGPAEAAVFLKRYREAFENVLSVFARVRTPVLRIDTSTGDPDRIADVVRTSLQMTTLGRTP